MSDHKTYPGKPVWKSPVHNTDHKPHRPFLKNNIKIPAENLLFFSLLHKTNSHL